MTLLWCHFFLLEITLVVIHISEMSQTLHFTLKYSCRTFWQDCMVKHVQSINQLDYLEQENQFHVKAITKTHKYSQAFFSYWTISDQEDHTILQIP